MKVLLAGVGSAGDVHPLLAIGQALQARGHTVELLANPAHAQAAAQSAIPLHAIGDAAQADRAAAHPLLWHPVHGLGVLWRYLLRPAVLPVFQRIEAVARTGRCCVVASPLMMGARVARERLGVPLLNVYTAPMMLRSCENPMSIANWRVPAWLPRAGRQWLWRALDRYKLDPLLSPDVRAARQRWDLPVPGSSVLERWMPSPDGGCTLFPDWFAHASDWPANVQQAGFMLFDGDAAQPLSPPLEAFLNSGPPPVVFTPGTARREAAGFFAEAIRACGQGGWRAVLVGGHRALAPLPADARNIHAVDYAAFSALLPRSAAIVHHGGIGTCAQALKAGVPQLVLPAAYDQFDNGWRLEALGVGATLVRQRAQQGLLAPLRRLLGDPLVRESCAMAARGMDAVAARARVCEQVEGLA